MNKSILTVGLLIAVSIVAAADDFCGCPNCGSCELRSVCRLVPEVKKVTKTIYGCKEEEACLPGRSRKCEEECVVDCNTKSGCGSVKTWVPTCGRIICKKSLTKKTVTEEKEVCTCKLFKRCCNCGYEFDPKKSSGGESKEAK